MNEYPLHRLVFENDLNGLSHYLKQESSKVFNSRFLRIILISHDLRRFKGSFGAKRSEI
jgi:hypothetical protein